jgi:hypothetical protein
MFHSSVLRVFANSTLAVTSLAMFSTTPPLDQAAFSLQSPSVQERISNTSALNTQVFTESTQQGWLIADNDDNRAGRRGRDRDDDDDDDDDDDKKGRVVRIDLNRAKNLARQAAEAANGGIRVYRAESSMHGPAAQCPYVDNGDFWTFTFLGGRPGATRMTTESVVRVYKNTSRVVVAYNGVIRTTQQNQVVTFTNNQRTVLANLLRGTCDCNYLVNNALRTQITRQARSLPPGIHKQLLRGKGLPPGIVQKLVRLPKQVNTYVNLPTIYDLGVIGSNVVLINQVNYRVVDVISNVF